MLSLCSLSQQTGNGLEQPFNNVRLAGAASSDTNPFATLGSFDNVSRPHVTWEGEQTFLIKSFARPTGIAISEVRHR